MKSIKLDVSKIELLQRSKVSGKSANLILKTNKTKQLKKFRGNGRKNKPKRIKKFKKNKIKQLRQYKQNGNKSRKSLKRSKMKLHS